MIDTCGRKQDMTNIPTDKDFELTRDMVDTLARYFDTFAEDGVVRIVKDETGLWLQSADRRAYLGRARPPARKRRRLN